MNALCCQTVWDLSSALTWQHAFSVSGVTLAANREPNPGELTVGAYACVCYLIHTKAIAFIYRHKEKKCLSTQITCLFSKMCKIFKTKKLMIFKICLIKDIYIYIKKKKKKLLTRFKNSAQS